MSTFAQWLAHLRSRDQPAGAANPPSPAPESFRFADSDLNLRQIDWLQFQWRPSLRRIPAIVLLLAAGVYFQQPAAGVLAAGTALSIGFGANRQVCHSRLQAMILTTLFMAVAGFTGSLVGNVYAGIVLVTFLFGFGSGLLSVVNEDIGWITMQGAIAFLIASAFPSDLKFALLRTSFVLLGGGTQILCILLIWQLERIGRFGPESAPATFRLARARASLNCGGTSFIPPPLPPLLFPPSPSVLRPAWESPSRSPWNWIICSVSKTAIGCP